MYYPSKKADRILTIKVRGETLEVARVPVNQLKNIDLAFDHKKILKTAGLID